MSQEKTKPTRDEPTKPSHPPATHHVSDVVLADDATGAAPSFPAPLPPPDLPVDPEETQKLPDVQKPSPRRDRAPMAMLPGAKVDDFEVVKLLGRGAFGHVYLARQLSLDRLVALKVSANRGSEGRTMARLEHQHIVQVYSEKVETDFNQRLLCMQLVPGIGLEKLIGALHVTAGGMDVAGGGGHGAGSGVSARDADWNGAGVLAIIDQSASLPAALDTSALHDREALGRMDAVEATAWFGSRLAEALDFAHRHGVLHRDIKPANILVNPYGRPMLADFNISSQPVGSESSGDEMFGGTFAYMAPEHLDAFNPGHEAGPEAVTPSSDLYSLGLVLQQLLDGRMPVAMPERKAKMVDMLRTMADERRRLRPTCSAGTPGAHMTLERSISKCLEPDEKDRYTSGAELGEQLSGCRRLREAERQLPVVRPVFQPIVRRPFLWLIPLVLIPQLIGSAVNITYNYTQIVGKLTEPQKEMFEQLVLGYNAVVYPIALTILVLTVWRVLAGWNALARAEPIAAADVEAVRRKALRLPGWIAGLVAFGWFPGGVIFPAVIMARTSDFTWHMAAHFVASFWMSGLIALAYSLCGVMFIVIRVLYPGLWLDVRNFGETARRELAGVTTQIGWIQGLASSIPLVGAVLIVLAGDTTSFTFRLLVVALILLGIVGAHVTNYVTRRLNLVVTALTGTKA
jgi:eukaryotic-like serine/threonine-protein kinase